MDVADILLVAALPWHWCTPTSRKTACGYSLACRTECCPLAWWMWRGWVWSPCCTAQPANPGSCWPATLPHFSEIPAGQPPCHQLQNWRRGRPRRGREQAPKGQGLNRGGDNKAVFFWTLCRVYQEAELLKGRGWERREEKGGKERHVAPSWVYLLFLASPLQSLIVTIPMLQGVWQGCGKQNNGPHRWPHPNPWNLCICHVT